MRRHKLLWMTGSLVLMLAFTGGINTANAGYVAFPMDAGTLMADFTAFVNDFGSWNSSQNNMPMMLLANAPSSQQGQTALVLMWWWLQSGGMNNSSASSNPVSGNGNGNGINFPASGGSSGGGSSGGVLPPSPVGGSGGGSPVPGGGSSGNGGGLGGGGGGTHPNVSPNVGAPAPSALTLSCTGLVGLLLYGCARRRLRRAAAAV